MALAYAAVCPVCSARLGARFAWNTHSSAQRICPKCHARLRRVSIEPWPVTILIGAGFVGLATIFALVTILMLSTGGSMLWMLLLPAGVAAMMLFNAVQYPFTNGFEVLPPQCRRCGYDMRGSPDGTCPECGART